MNTLLLTKRFGKTLLLAILASILMVATALTNDVSPKAAKGDSEKVVRQVVDNWIQIGAEQYKRGRYADAEKSFLRAKDYENYLTAVEREKLDENIQQAHKAAIEKETTLAAIRNAEELAAQQKFADAKAHLQVIQTADFLTDEERQLIKKRIEAIDKELAAQKKMTAEIYTDSVEAFRAGELDKAREGFLKIASNDLLVTPPGESPADYLAKIDKMLAEQGKLPSAVEPVSEQPAERQIESGTAVEKPKKPTPVVPLEINEVAEPSPAAVAAEKSESLTAGTAEPVQEQTGYIGVINRRLNIIRGRVKAVVNDAAAKAEDFISKGQFDEASQAVDAAQKVVYENQKQLGDYLFNQYSGQLKQLSDRIEEGQKLQAQQKEEQKRASAEQAQQEYKSTMAVEREKRIADLLQNAINFQKQQRYEEAIGQLEMLIAIDPQHNQALILKQTLEDTVSYRKQLEIEKEKNREKFDTLLEIDRTTIPYADDMTYPKTWREILAKPTRQPEEAASQDPANAQTEKQLDEIVDLPGLSPEMPLREAIKVLQSSVEPPLKVFVNYSDLYNKANVDQTTPINMDPQTNIRLRTALELLLDSVSAGVADLGYVVKDGVVTIATQASLPSRMEARVYDVTIVVGRPADYYVSAGAGGGTGGGRGGGGGGGGAGGGIFQEYFEEQETDVDRATLNTELRARIDSLVILIQQTIAPMSWFDVGGDASITPYYDSKKLVILQTPDNHREIEKLLKDMRKALGNQVAIEARFLVVGENFLEEIGLDVYGNLYLGKTLGYAPFSLESFRMAQPESTGLPGSFPLTDPTQGVQFPRISTGQIMPPGGLMTSFGGSFGGVLDNLEANFLIRATQAHRDSESLVAPKVTVLSGESATLQVRRTIRYPLLPTVSVSGVSGVSGVGAGGSSFQQNYGEIPTGPTLNITPTITSDKKHVLLNIVAELQDFLEFKTTTVEAPIPGGVGGQPTGVYSYSVTLPQTERSRVKTRVNVPDGGTLLLGGLKRSAGIEKEIGVPILSKIPIIGRVFTNRSKVNDQKILLILVKPTIILQEEADAEAIAAMEGQP